MDKVLFTSLQIEELTDLIKSCIRSEFKNLPQQTELNEQPEDLLSTEDIQRMFNVSKVTIYKWKKKGILPYYKMNSRVYFKKSEVIDSLKHKKRKLEV